MADKNKGICRACGKEDILYKELCKECNLYYTQGKQNENRRKEVNSYYRDIRK